MTTEHELTAPADAPRLDVFVAQALDLSRNQAATLIAEGHVLVNGRRERASYRAREGESIRVEIPPPPGRDVLPENIPLSVVFEDDDVLVVDKPAATKGAKESCTGWTRKRQGSCSSRKPIAHTACFRRRCRRGGSSVGTRSC